MAKTEEAPSKYYSVRELVKLKEQGKLNFDLVFQRKGNVWNLSQRSLLIETALTKLIKIPTLLAKKDKDGTLSFVDGQQRILAFLAFINDEFILSAETSKVNGIEIKGLSFSKLPEEFQNIILDTKLEVEEKMNVSDAVLAEMFRRRNSGTPLRPFEINRIIMGPDNLEILTEVAKHPFVQGKAKISKLRDADQELVTQLFMIAQDPGTGFSGRETKAFFESFAGRKISDDLIAAVTKGLDYLDKAFDKKHNYLKRSNLPMLYIASLAAMQHNITPENFNYWAKDFYQQVGKDHESAYYLASQSGSARREKVQIRLSLVLNSLAKTFNIDLNAVTTQQQEITYTK